MCGRLVLTSSFKEKIKAIFAGLTDEKWIVPNYNLSPGQSLPVLKSLNPSNLEWLEWGYENKLNDDGGKDSRKMINARAETVDRLPSFRDSFHRRRCIVLADGFYEWRRDAVTGKSQPYFFGMTDNDPLILAGLYTDHDTPSNRPGCLVITTEANSLMHPIHDRMPVIFTPESADLWLDSHTADDTLRTMLQPFPSNRMIFHPVSDRVNKVIFNGPDLIAPVKIFEQTSLF